MVIINRTVNPTYILYSNRYNSCLCGFSWIEKGGIAPINKCLRCGSDKYSIHIEEDQVPTTVDNLANGSVDKNQSGVKAYYKDKDAELRKVMSAFKSVTIGSGYNSLEKSKTISHNDIYNNTVKAEETKKTKQLDMIKTMARFRRNGFAR